VRDGAGYALPGGVIAGKVRAIEEAALCAKIS
jgi:hypothetical protein